MAREITLGERVKLLEDDMKIVKDFIKTVGELLKSATESVKTEIHGRYVDFKLFVDGQGNFCYYTDEVANKMVEAGYELTPFEQWQKKRQKGAQSVSNRGFAVGDRVLHKCKNGFQFTATIEKITDMDTAVLKDCSDKDFNGAEISLSSLINCTAHEEPKWKLTDDDKAILRNVSECFNYLVRDNDGDLTLFCDKPHKDGDCWDVPPSKAVRWVNFSLFNGAFNTIQWEDDEPCEFRRYL